MATCTGIALAMVVLGQTSETEGSTGVMGGRAIDLFGVMGAGAIAWMLVGRAKTLDSRTVA